ncbi:MAG TPA: SpoIID/LytB domain-containing protein [Planctomycetota bacterium]|nr:SpoIID/LytB domain-containing protein [Planctomycetota bacterium]
MTRAAVIDRHLIVLLVVIAGLLALAACKVGTREDSSAYDRPARSAPTARAASRGADGKQPVAPRSTASAASTAPTPGAPARRPQPALDREPIVDVLLAEGPRVRFVLASAGEADCGGTRVRVPAGEVVAEAVGGRVRLAGGSAASIAITGAAGFSATLRPPFGAEQKLSFSGAPVLIADGRNVLLIERVALERYLAGVLPVEMSPSYPLAALEAQAVAARSYACAKILDRFDQPWQLHWHFTVDMAYHGAAVKTSDNVRRALADTRGVLLTYRRMPVPALFYASSGGTTESAGNVWPDLRFADGTPATAAMPVVADPACEGGARGLKLTGTHWRWKANITLADVGRGLQQWSREKPGRPSFGTVDSVRVVDRAGDSKRVAHVAVRHRSGKKKPIETTITGHDFRMAVGPGVVRSTSWDRCVIAKDKGGILVLEGRGFGHGVGLSQISAWQMARSGSSSDAILQRFYPGAVRDDRW